MPNDNDLPTHTYRRYQSYLLRLWQEQPHMLWRASLQDATTNERIAFLDLESLFTYVRQQAHASKETDEGEPSSSSETRQ